MGSVIGTVLEENFKKQELFLREANRTLVERNLHSHNQLRERLMAFELSRQKDLFHYYSVFYGFVVLAAIGGVVKKNARAVMPVVPFTIAWVYQYDAAYLNKVHRIRAEAERMMREDQDILLLPHNLPTIEGLDKDIKEQRDQTR